MRMTPPSLLVTLALLVSSGPPALAKIWKVPGNAPTVQAAVDQATSGDVIAVKKGVYKENVVFQGKVGITLKGLGNAKLAPASGVPLSILNSTQIVVRKLRIVSKEADGISIDQSPFVRIEKCNIRSDGTGLESAIDVDLSLRTLIFDNKIKGTSFAAISLDTSDESILSGNKITRAAQNGNDLRVFGARITVVDNQIDSPTTHLLATGSLTVDLLIAGNQTKGSQATSIVTSSDTSGTLTLENHITGSAVGIDSGGSSEVLHGNVVKKSGTTGILLDGPSSDALANEIFKTAGNGLYVSTNGLLISYNEVTKSGLFDLVEFGNPSGVYYQNNTFGTISP